MGSGLSISGGADGIAARHDDLLSHAAVLDGVGRDFGDVAAALAGINISPDIAEAAVLCPVEVAEAEAALVAANIGPDGAAVAWARAEVSAEFLRFSVAAYREVDSLMTEIGSGAQFVGGFIVGYTGLPALVAPVLGAVGDPLPSGQRTLYDHPWLQELIVRGAPGYAEGTMFSAAGVALTPLLTGGGWPAFDFQGALQGLIVLGGRFGALADSGMFSPRPVGPTREGLDFRGDAFLSHAMIQQQELSKDEARVQIVTISGADGPAYVVQIPGTQEWGPVRNANPIDLTSDVNLAAGHRTKLSQAVVDAMRSAHIPPGAPVMLTGHSQGGIVAADIASDSRYLDEFNIRAVVTAGSPIGHVSIPGHVSVLSLEEEQDLVPKLDGAANPDAPNWITVTRDLSQGSAADPHRDLSAAHSLVNYEQTAYEVDASGDPAIVKWRSENRAFFGSGTAQQYLIAPVRGD